MFEIATMTPKRMLVLPETITRHFQTSDRFIVWMEDDMVHLKRITQVSPLQAVADAPDESPPSLEEIDAIVHEVRQRRPHQPHQLPE